MVIDYKIIKCFPCSFIIIIGEGLLEQLKDLWVPLGSPTTVKSNFIGVVIT